MSRSLLTALPLVVFMPLMAQAQSSVQQVGWKGIRTDEFGQDTARVMSPFVDGIWIQTTGSSALQGARTLTEISVSTPDTSWTEANLQPSVYVFFNGSPRRGWRWLTKNGLYIPLDEVRLEVFGPFVPSSGYQRSVSGTPLTIQPLVALYPNAISDTSEYTYTHRVEGDTLRLTLSAPWAEGGEVRYTLRR